MDKSVIQEAREALSTLESEAHGLGMRSEYRHQLAASIRAGLSVADQTTTPTPATTAETASYQDRVQPWMMECFGAEISADKVERNHRFLEESLELVQSLGCGQKEASLLVDYVYGRPAGDPPQEVGGVRVTLAALCLANDIDQDECAEKELARVWTKVDQIREKQKSKPAMSPLPGVYPDRPTPPQEQ